MLNYHYLGQELGSTCFEVQRRLGNTMTLNSPWKTRQNTCRSENNVLKYSLWDGVFVCVQLPRCIQWQKLYSLLQHRLEAQGKWERNLSCKKQNKPQLIVNIIQYTRQNIYQGVMYLLVTNPEKVQLIHPPMRIMGSTFVTLPFIMSVSMLGSVGCYNHIVKHMSAKKKKR